MVAPAIIIRSAMARLVGEILGEVLSDLRDDLRDRRHNIISPLKMVTKTSTQWSCIFNHITKKLNVQYHSDIIRISY